MSDVDRLAALKRQVQDEVLDHIAALKRVVLLHDSYVWGEARPIKKPEWLKRWAETISEEVDNDNAGSRAKVTEGHGAVAGHDPSNSTRFSGEKSGTDEAGRNAPVGRGDDADAMVAQPMEKVGAVLHRSHVYGSGAIIRIGRADQVYQIRAKKRCSTGEYELRWLEPQGAIERMKRREDAEPLAGDPLIREYQVEVRDLKRRLAEALEGDKAHRMELARQLARTLEERDELRKGAGVKGGTA